MIPGIIIDDTFDCFDTVDMAASASTNSVDAVELRFLDREQAPRAVVNGLTRVAAKVPHLCDVLVLH